MDTPHNLYHTQRAKRVKRFATSDVDVVVVDTKKRRDVIVQLSKKKMARDLQDRAEQLRKQQQEIRELREEVRRLKEQAGNGVEVVETSKGKSDYTSHETSTSELSRENIERYSRQLLLNDGFGVEGQRKLLSSSVLVIGAGGIGSTGKSTAIER